MKSGTNKQNPKKNLNLSLLMYQRQMGIRRNITFKKEITNSLTCLRPLHIFDAVGPRNRKPISAIAFDPSGQILATGGFNLNLWYWNGEKVFIRKEMPSKSLILNLKFLNLCGGYHIVICQLNGEVIYKHIEDDVRMSQNLISYRRSACNVTTDKTTPQVMLSGGDSTINRHDLRMNPGEINRVLSGDFIMSHMDSNPRNFNEFVLGNVIESCIRVYDQRNTKAAVSLYLPSPGDKYPLSSFYNHDGTEILATFQHGIYLFDHNTKSGRETYCDGGSIYDGNMKAKFFGPDSRYIVCGSERGYITIWDKQTTRVVQREVAELYGEVNDVEGHPNQPYLCSIGADHEVKLWMPMGNIDMSIEYNNK